ncbi:MAG TPA: transcriptional repressor [Tepidisphaeraceae bacterium]|jgi:Fur family ferric uptake transcriptional regulator
MSKEQNNLMDLLHNVGLRHTPVRAGALEVLAKSKSPLSAPQILSQLPANTDNVTLYRTLNTLTGKRLLHRVRGDDQIWRYGIGDGTARHEHAHFVCDECGAVQCLPDMAVENSPRRTSVGPGYRVDYSEVLVHGACPDCRR